MSGRKSDPVVAAWDRLQAAEKASASAYDERDIAEDRAYVAGFKVRQPIVSVGKYDCMSMASARCHARELPKAEAVKAIDAMRMALKAQREQRRKAGLAPFDIAKQRTEREWSASMQAMADTRATTPMGVILKLQLIELELRDGDTVFGKAILASAIADLSRIGRQRPIAR